MGWWTVEKVRLLRDFRDEGKTFAMIAQEMQVSRGTIAGKVRRLKAAQAELPLDVDDEPFPATGATSTWELQFGQCRWPEGDPLSKSFRYCAERVGHDAKGKPRVAYCDCHYAMSVGGGTPSERRAHKDAWTAAK